VFVRLDTVDHDATWKAIGVPYVSENGFDIDGAVGDAVLTLEAGSELRLGEDASVVVRSDGGLTLDGTDSDHVTVASALSPQSPGDWHEIVIQSGSVGASNVFRYTDISHGGGSYFGQLNLATDDTEVTLDHVTFSQAGEGCDVYGDGTVHATASTYVVCP
jgi:hypothetical protein